MQRGRVDTARDQAYTHRSRADSATKRSRKQSRSLLLLTELSILFFEPYQVMTALTGRAQSPGLHPLSGLPILSDDGDDPEQFARATANYDIADRYTLAHPAASSTNARLVGSPEVNKELLPPLSEYVALSGLYERGRLFSEDETLGRSGYPSIDPTYEVRKALCLL